MSALVIVAGLIAIGVVSLLKNDTQRDNGKLVAGVFIVLLALLTLVFLSMNDDEDSQLLMPSSSFLAAHEKQPEYHW